MRRVTRVERVIDSEGLVNLLKQIEQLQKDTQDLREQVDQLQFKLDQAGAAQKQQYLDVDQRCRARKGAWRPACRPSAMRAAFWMVASSARPVAGSRRHRPGELPGRLRTAEAGPLQGGQRRAQAVHGGLPGQFAVRQRPVLAGRNPLRQPELRQGPARNSRVVVDKYPQSRKIPDALLKIGYCNYELKRFDAARKALQRWSPTTRRPRRPAWLGQRLERMTSEGH